MECVHQLIKFVTKHERLGVIALYVQKQLVAKQIEKEIYRSGYDVLTYSQSHLSEREQNHTLDSIHERRIRIIILFDHIWALDKMAKLKNVASYIILWDYDVCKTHSEPIIKYIKAYKSYAFKMNETIEASTLQEIMACNVLNTTNKFVSHPYSI